MHWVVYNLPAETVGLAVGASRTTTLPPGTREGYAGPCPPIGRHRYVHKLYALDTVLPVPKPATKAVLEKTMQGHILAKGELMGYYKKKK